MMTSITRWVLAHKRLVTIAWATVAIGLLAMVVLPLPFLRSIGFAGMLIPLVSVIVAMTLLPVVLARAGSRLDLRTFATTTRRAGRGPRGHGWSFAGAGSRPSARPSCSRRS